MRNRLVLAAALGVCLVLQLGAQAANQHFKNGIYIGAAGLYSSIEGDFDGETYFDSGVEVIVVPKLDPGMGVGGVLGYRESNFALEFGFSYTAHDSKWAGGSFDTTATAFTLDIKWLPLTGSAVQPYIVGGLGFSTVTVEDGSQNIALEIGDAKYTGIFFRPGLGLAFYMTRSIFLCAQGTYRFNSYNEASGVEEDTLDLSDSLSGDGYEAALVLGITF